MSNRSRGRHGGAGSVRHFDSNGNRTGYSRKNISGGFTDYDRKGRAIGHSEKNSQGGYDHYDNHGNKIGSSDSGEYHNGTSRVTHSSGDYRSNSSSSSANSGYSGSNSSSGSEGCYVATCIYGSYDCPQVWTLRRFRDTILARTAPGRAFIHTYYAISPTIVKWFGNTHWFQSVWKRALDPMVCKLNAAGVADTPYLDRNWRT